MVVVRKRIPRVHKRRRNYIVDSARRERPRTTKASGKRVREYIKLKYGMRTCPDLYKKGVKMGRARRPWHELKRIADKAARTACKARHRTACNSPPDRK